MDYKCDILIIGGGGAAVRAAVEAANPELSVLMVDKGDLGRSGTSPLSLHGFLSTLDPADSENILFSDLIKTGCSISDLDLLRVAVRDAKLEPSRLEKMGVRFVHQADGSYDIYKGAGHSVPHGLTFDDDGNCINLISILGKEAWKKGVKLLERIMITELLVNDEKIEGAAGIDCESRPVTIKAKAVILAAGGANRLYPNTVPRIAQEMFRTTGDGYILAFDAGVPLVDMEFANFRDSPPAARLGGTYINSKGEAFMERYEPERKEKAPRGNVVEALYREIQAGNGPVYIKINEESERNVEFLPEEYKSYVRAIKEGQKPSVTITFQRLLGGARINPDTSTAVEGLFVAGENAGGFHGADRVQGAAFLETQVFGRLAGESAAKFALSHEGDSCVSLFKDAVLRVMEDLKAENAFAAGDILKKLQRVTWDNASIVKDRKGLEKGLEDVLELKDDIGHAAGLYPFEKPEIRNLIRTAEIVIRSSLAREETRGTHRRSDFPEENPALSGKHISLEKGNAREPCVKTVPSRT
jgi:succinate dehydrogenase/fumarate reductase flavoprotein subunit